MEYTRSASIDLSPDHVVQPCSQATATTCQSIITTVSRGHGHTLHTFTMTQHQTGRGVCSPEYLGPAGGQWRADWRRFLMLTLRWRSGGAVYPGYHHTGSHVHKHLKHQHLPLPTLAGGEEEPVPSLTVDDCVQRIDPWVGVGGGCGQVCGCLVTRVI